MSPSTSTTNNMMQMISYLSKDGSKDARQLEQLEQFFDAHPWVKFVQFRWVDFSGVLRTRILAKRYCLELVRDNKHLQSARIALDSDISNTLVPPGLDALGSNTFHPDWTTLKAFPSGDRPGSQYAHVMCAISSKSFGQPDGAVPDICPRKALTNVLQKIKEILDVGLLVGFEVEFTIMQLAEGSGYKPYSQCHGYGMYAGMRDKAFKIVEECLDQLLELGVEMQCAHTEGSKRGQYEISLAPLPPMEAIDQLIIVQSTLKDVAARHGYQATMSPKPVATQSTNGQHVHLSLNPPKNEESFLAGILGRLGGICSISLPYQASWQRISGPFQAGNTVSWGTANRLATIRKIKPGHWEIRCVDAMGNMYLTLAAILSAGLLGVLNNEPLTWQDSSRIREDGVRLTADSFGNTKEPKLPEGLAEALDELEKNAEDLQTLVGNKAFHHHVALKRQENERLSKLSAEELNNLLIEMF